MPTDHRERLANIRRFDQLVAYLRDELRWPIDSDDFEELTFEYTPEELGIDASNAAKIQQIKRLRPLTPRQPWGVFFVKFEPKRLPVVALRRILGRVALKKRASANTAERQAWATDDLLFVSNYGEGRERRIALAHFSKPHDANDLPTLKVLGWDNLDTPLHLDAVARDLTGHLTWPDDEDDRAAWRERWRAAFSLRHREIITTSKVLSDRLAELARATRDRILTALSIENESGQLTQLMNAFQTSLVHNLDDARFADMYAQTIAYGLLSARITDPTRRTADDFADHMKTNPFLRELMGTFIRVGGRRGNPGETGIDFDELGVSEVIELLDQARMEDIVRDFGDRNPQEDPVIHFYEHFLAAYDRKMKIERGVFYTPRPVVSYIVRSIDNLLRSAFGLTAGLADTTTWGEMVERHENLTIPPGVSPTQAFVQILDPATGTGTFLVEVIDLIHDTMAGKWRSQGHDEKVIQAFWNEYVPKHLLPRLHGYELLMAPYAIAHLKISLKLYETGYRFASSERARVYLTNALLPAGSKQITLDFLPALAQEAQAVNEIKRNRRFTVVMGNPPYLGEAGRGDEWIAALMRGRETQTNKSTLSYFKIGDEPLGERNPKWVNDLYVRFTRLSHWLLEQSGVGVHGFITNHGYLNNPTFRGMRWALLTSFDQLFLLDLHGNLHKKEVDPDGRLDENIFDIERGVAVGLFVMSSTSKTHRVPHHRVHHANRQGTRIGKYRWLLDNTASATTWEEISPRARFYLFKPFASLSSGHYEKWTSIREVFPVGGTGVITKRDALSIHFDSEGTWNTVATFARMPEQQARVHFNLPPDVRDWRFDWAQRDVRDSGPSERYVRPILYRPFDKRYIYYTGRSRGFIGWPVVDVMGHMLAGDNYAIITARSNKFPQANHFFCSRTIVETKCGEASTQSATFPLYLYPGVGRADASFLNRQLEGKGARIPNLDPAFVEQLADATGLRFVGNGRGDLQEVFGAEDTLAWIYAVFHSPRYRERYEAHFKLDFPRVPAPGTTELFQQMSEAGHELLALHLFESSKTESEFLTTYTGPGNPEIGRVGWSNGMVWLDAGKTNGREGHRATKPGSIGFMGVPEAVWDFHIGGYQVCYKWLKGRKGRRLSNEEITHYHKIVVALNETIRLMTEIDDVVEAHGGWPDAFRTGAGRVEKRPALLKVAETSPPYGGGRAGRRSR